MTFKTGADLIAEAKTRIREVTVQQVRQELAGPGAPMLLDCREPQETNLSRLPNAIVIPRGQLETKIEAVVPRDAYLVIYCASGNRSALAADTLREMGYANVASMAGGINAWMMAGGPLEARDEGMRREVAHQPSSGPPAIIQALMPPAIDATFA
jgi:rhodanese-related sulfurtransferase